MKLTLEKNLWPIPRPYVTTGWEAHSMWIAFVIGNRHTDDVINLCLEHQLSDRQYRFLLKVFG